MFISFFAVGLGLSGNAVALKTEGEPSVKDYKLCSELLHNAHALILHPQDKLGAIINSNILFAKWIELSGISMADMRIEADRIVKKSVNEFYTKEHFYAAYSKEEHEYCLKLLEEEKVKLQ